MTTVVAVEFLCDKSVKKHHDRWNGKYTEWKQVVPNKASMNRILSFCAITWAILSESDRREIAKDDSFAKLDLHGTPLLVSTFVNGAFSMRCDLVEPPEMGCARNTITQNFDLACQAGRRREACRCATRDDGNREPAVLGLWNVWAKYGDAVFECRRKRKKTRCHTFHTCQ